MQFIELLLPLSKIISTCFVFCVCLLLFWWTLLHRVVWLRLHQDQGVSITDSIREFESGRDSSFTSSSLLFLLFLLLFLPHHLLFLLYKKSCWWREDWNTGSAINSISSLSCRGPRFSSQCPRDASDLRGQHTHTQCTCNHTGKTLIHKIFFLKKVNSCWIFQILRLSK